MYSIRIAAVVLVLSPASLVGQLQGPYLLSSGDTLTYREVSIGSVQIQTPQGMVAVGSTHDALISMTPGNDDRIAAWYSSLELGSSGPEGDVTPATDAPSRSRTWTRTERSRSRVTSLSGSCPTW